MSTNHVMHRFLFFAILLRLSLTVSAGNSYTFSSQGLKVTVTFFAPGIVRVFKIPENKPADKQSLSVIMKPEDVSITVDENAGNATVSSSKLRLTVNKESGGIVFCDSHGNTLLRDKDYGTQFTPVSDAGKPSYDVRQAFLLDKDEIIYGLGQQQTGLVSQRNQKLMLRNVNMSICVPFIHSEKGYGVYWDNYSPTLFTDNAQETAFDSEVGLCADYYFIYGGNADGVISGVRQLTGDAPMFPLWTMGFWQSRERYRNPEELCGVVDKYRELRVPLDGIVQDWQYWGDNSNWNAMEFANPRYAGGKAKEMIDHVHKQNAHIMISVWPSFGYKTDMYHRMDSLKALLHFKTYPNEATVYDPFNPKAREIFWQKMKTNIFDLGMDAWWLDATEPEHKDPVDADYDQPTWLGSFRSVHNAFPIVSNREIYERQRAVTSDKRVFLLTRSSSFGQQHYGSFSWSGDIVGNWDVMRRQIAAGMNYSLCGFPYWNTDIGGFFARDYGNDVKNPAYQEMHVRWFEWGAFQPLMRSHNSGPVAVEIWQFGKKGDWAYDALEKFTKLRYSLLPYIYSMMWQVNNKQGSIIRPLLMDFKQDRKALTLGDEYMFGKSFLVRPVTDSIYTWMDSKLKGHVKDFSKTGSVSVYLPEGARWYDLWDNKVFDGGQTIQRLVPIDIMPVYVRAGSIVPWGPDVQYSTEKKWDNLEVRVYSGANASFTLYEDEFDNYNYEKGAYTEIPFTWDEASRTFTIGSRKGSYKGMLKNRTFKVKLIGGQQKTVKYRGQQKQLRF